MVSEHRNVGVTARVIEYCARNPLLTLLVTLAFVIWGYRALLSTPVDAVPDLSDTQVIVYTEWLGRSPDLVEDQITYPLTTQLLSAPRVREVRAQSVFGASYVYVIFEDGTDLYWARSRTLEYLDAARARLPANVQPRLGPDASGVGWVFQYALVDKSKQHSIADLRSFQDFYLRYWLAAVDGVAEVASIGGYAKEYQVQLDPQKLAAFNVSLKQVRDALATSNNDVGGQAIELSGHENIVRGRGYVRRLEDLRGIVLSANAAGVPVTLGDVSEINIGPGLRRGFAELDGEGETVGAIVVMRHGEDAIKVIEGVKKRLEETAPSFPPGVEIVITYDRSELINRALDTLKSTLLEEMIVVSIVIAVFLLHFRSALIAILTLPVAVLLSFIPMSGQHLTANIMSLGGIAVAIGAMVDASMVIIENIHRRIEQWEQGGKVGERSQQVILAMQEVGPSIFFSLVIITVSFIPVFALQGVEGRLFHPLAYTKSYAMGFSALLAITFTPALAMLLVRGRLRGDRNIVNRVLIAGYRPIAALAVRWRWGVIGVFIAAGVATVPVFMKLQSEFMPSMNEGSLLYMPTTLPGLTVTDASRLLQTMNQELRKFPEVERVFGKIGRAETPTDPAPMSMVETIITLKPPQTWRPGVTLQSLIGEMDDALTIPGMPNVWWMPIQTRTEMLNTGIRSELGIKVYGSQIDTVEDLAIRIEEALSQDDRTKDLTRSVFAERLRGGYYVDFTVKRDQAARYGLSVADVEEAMVMAIGGIAVSEAVEGRERYAISLRYARDFREDPEQLKRVLVTTPGGAHIPLIEVADIDFVSGPPMLRNEDGQLVGYVFIDVNDEYGVADYAAIAQKVIADRVAIPAGIRWQWAGQYQYYERAKQQLYVVVPVTLLVVLIMLFVNSRSVVESLLILLSVPLSLTGAVLILYWLNFKLSVATWVGMIALAGLDAELGILMMLYLGMAYRDRVAAGQLNTWHDLTEAIVEGAARRIRPKLMTGTALLLGLVPILWSDGTGADVMKRIAAPMVGGIASTLAMVLLLYPALFAVWKGMELRTKAE